MVKLHQIIEIILFYGKIMQLTYELYEHLK